MLEVPYFFFRVLADKICIVFGNKENDANAISLLVAYLQWPSFTLSSM